jgi:hypothetical protein
VTVFPGEIYRAPRSWGEQNFHELIYWNEVDKGGHFAAWEQPDIFVDEVRAAFRSLRWPVRDAGPVSARVPRSTPPHPEGPPGVTAGG